MVNGKKINENQMSQSFLEPIHHAHNSRMLCRCRFGFKGNSWLFTFNMDKHLSLSQVFKKPTVNSQGD